LSIDRAGLPAIRKFYANLGLKSLGIYADQAGAALHQLGLIGIPGTLLIDTDGREIGRKLGPAEWDSPEVVALLRSHFGLDAAKARGGGRAVTSVSGIALIASLLAGMVSFLSPCVLPLVPGYVSYVGGRSLRGGGDGSGSRFAALWFSGIFVLGFSTVFITLGASATAIGRLL